MSETHTDAGEHGAIGRDNVDAIGAADWLCLAAAPTFAFMALLTGVLDGGAPDLFCLAMTHASPLGGMVPMYLLMSAFHAAPWLRLISGRRSGPRRSDPAAHSTCPGRALAYTDRKR